MSKTLLLADDSITIQKVVGITFANEDYQIVSVDNGEDAVLKAAAIKPDIILADVVMPKMDGYQVCEKIKADDSLKHIPVLLLTGAFKVFDEEKSKKVGADGHIAKPFDSQALIDKVNELANRPSQRPAPASYRPQMIPPATPPPATGISPSMAKDPGLRTPLQNQPPAAFPASSFGPAKAQPNSNFGFPSAPPPAGMAAIPAEEPFRYNPLARGSLPGEESIEGSLVPEPPITARPPAVPRQPYPGDLDATDPFSTPREKSSDWKTPSPSRNPNASSEGTPFPQGANFAFGQTPKTSSPSGFPPFPMTPAQESRGPARPEPFSSPLSTPLPTASPAATTPDEFEAPSPLELSMFEGLPRETPPESLTFDSDAMAEENAPENIWAIPQAQAEQFKTPTYPKASTLPPTPAFEPPVQRQAPQTPAPKMPSAFSPVSKPMEPQSPKGFPGFPEPSSPFFGSPSQPFPEPPSEANAGEAPPWSSATSAFEESQPMPSFQESYLPSDDMAGGSAEPPDFSDLTPVMASTPDEFPLAISEPQTSPKAYEPSAKITTREIHTKVEDLQGMPREVIERIAWEIIPDLAETIIREEIERLKKEKGVFT